MTRNRVTWSVWALLLWALCLQPVSAAEGEVNQAQLDRLKKDISELTAWLDTANKKASGLQTALASLERDISINSVAVLRIRERQQQLVTEQSLLKQQKNLAAQKIDAQKHQIAQLIVAGYKTGDKSMVRLLLDQDDPLFWRRMLAYSQRISSHQLALILDYKRNLEIIADAEASLVEKEQEYKTASLELALKQQALVKQKTDRAQVLGRLNNQIQSSGEKLEGLKADRARLESLLAKMAEAIDSLVPTEMLQAFEKRKGSLQWPVSGKVVQSFGSKMGNGPLTSQGIIIKTGVNSPVNAVHHGRVVFADWLNGFGLLMIIDHGEGYMSLYARNEVLMRSVGEWVNTGDLLSKSGDNGLGTEGLYFEVRHMGKPQNPLFWLSKSR